jgi:hypothetical protein
MASAGSAVPEHPRQITVPIGGGFSIRLPDQPLTLQIVAALIGAAWAAQQQWVEQAKEQRAHFWCDTPGTLLLNLWAAGRIEFWTRETMHLRTALICLDFAYPERLASQFTLDPLLGRLTYLPDGRVFYDLHVRAAMPAKSVPQQPEPPGDDAGQVPTATASVAVTPDRRRPATWFFDIADRLLAEGLDPDDPHCWSMITARLKPPPRKGDPHYIIDQVRLAMKFRAAERSQRNE